MSGEIARAIRNYRDYPESNFEERSESIDRLARWLLSGVFRANETPANDRARDKERKGIRLCEISSSGPGVNGDDGPRSIASQFSVQQDHPIIMAFAYWLMFAIALAESRDQTAMFTANICVMRRGARV